MPTLGPGSRVWIGWAPSSDVAPEYRVVIGQKATVLHGPHSPDIMNHPVPPPCKVIWYVRPDNFPKDVYVCEYLLIPIDDEDGMEEEKCQELEA